jgi:hypothetical protein
MPISHEHQVPRLSAACLCLSLGLALCGCGDGLSRSTISGKVTVGGAPLKAGRILFIPVPPLQGPTASAAVIDGSYAIPVREGPVAGTHRVEVEAELPLGFPIDDEAAFARRGGGPLPPNPIPLEFNRQSQLTTTIKPGKNTFDVTVPAAASPRGAY